MAARDVTALLLHDGERVPDGAALAPHSEGAGLPSGEVVGFAVFLALHDTQTIARNSELVLECFEKCPKIGIGIRGY